MKAKTPKTLTVTAATSAWTRLALAAGILALLAIPHLTHAQGMVGGVKGVLGIPDHGYRRGYRCRGYYDRYSRFHCYR